MHHKLKEIVIKTKQDLQIRKQQVPLEKLKGLISSTCPRPFLKTFKDKRGKSLAIIAEIKLSSPTQKNLGSKKDLIKRVKKYQQAGADFISVVTEKYFFNGDPAFVGKIKKVTPLPILQKDFIIDPYQLYESKVAGADAILLIAKIISKKDLIFLVKLAQQLGLEPVVEINNQVELKNAIASFTKIIAVNARNLDTFVINIDHACKLIKKIPNKFIKLGFSGISQKEDAQKYKNAGANGILIGTSLMKAKNIKKHFTSLLNVRVKICGIRTKAAALAAYKAGADFLGFNFVPTSKSYIIPQKAKQIIKALKDQVKTVGVFQNDEVYNVNKIAKMLGLDFVQLHGDEDSNYIKKIEVPVIKSINADDKTIYPNAAYLLLDRKNRGQGKMVNFTKAKKLADNFSIFYAGGLTTENVVEVVTKVQPLAVDVASGLETAGKQDIEKIKQFIENAKEAI